MSLVFPGAGHLITTHRGWGIWSLASISCYVTLIPRPSRDKSWRRQALMHSKRKITLFVADWLKSKACTSFALYLKVFKNHLYYFRHVRVLSIKACLHTQLRSIIEATEKFPGGGDIWSPGMDLSWGIWTAFRPREGGNFPKIFQKFKCPGGCPGGGMFKLWFDCKITTMQIIRSAETITFLVVSRSSKVMFMVNAAVYPNIFAWALTRIYFFDAFEATSTLCPCDRCGKIWMLCRVAL